MKNFSQLTIKQYRDLVPVDESGQVFRNALVIVASITDGDKAYAYKVFVPEEYEDDPEIISVMIKLAGSGAQQGLDRESQK